MFSKIQKIKHVKVNLPVHTSIPQTVTETKGHQLQHEIMLGFDILLSIICFYNVNVNLPVLMSIAKQLQKQRDIIHNI